MAVARVRYSLATFWHCLLTKILFSANNGDTLCLHMYRDDDYVSGMATIGVLWRRMVSLKEGSTGREREKREETGEPEHLEGNKGDAGFTEASRAELQRSAPGAGDLLEEADGGQRW